MKSLCKISFILFLLFSAINIYGVDIEINGSMYRITKRGPLYYPSHASILTANPWWKNESLARSVAAQVNDDLGIDAYGKGPVFNYSEYATGWAGTTIYTTLKTFWHPQTNSVKDGMSGLGAMQWSAVATPLIDSDSDGIYDIDDAHPGFDDNSLDDYLASEGYVSQALYDAAEAGRVTALAAQANAENSRDAALAERDARPTQASYDAIVAERDARPTQASYDAIVTERDARPTQASYDAIVAEKDAKIEQFSALDSRINQILPKVVPEAPILSLESFNQLFAEGKQMIEESKIYAMDDYHFVDYKIGLVEELISTNNASASIALKLEDIIDYLDWSPLAHSHHYDFYTVKQKFEEAKNIFLSGNLESFNQLFAEGKQMIEESKIYATDDYHYVDYKIGQVEELISNSLIVDIGDELEDIIDELDWSPLAHSHHYDFYTVKQKFEEVKAEVDNQISIQNAYDPTPVATATLEEYITSLNSDITSAREERDAKLTMEEVRDMKLKSRMMQVDGGSASLNITLEATDNLGITSPTWTPIPEEKVIIHPQFQDGKIRLDIQGDDNVNVGTKFYRFKMDD